MIARTVGAVVLVVLVCAGCSMAGDVTFTAPPRATAFEGGARITFAMSEPTDVEVAILDADGDVVRHLAAGQLGPNAPEPLQRNSLAQTLLWDGRDNRGRPAEGGPFQVRVRAGLDVEYAGHAPGSETTPNDITNVIGLAAGPDGRTYVLTERWTRGHWRHTSVHVFRRDGDYEQTIKPFPSSLPAERVAGLTPFTSEDGRPLPTIYRVISMSYYPYEDLAQHMTVGPDGNLHLAVRRAAYVGGSHRVLATNKWLASIAPDGGLAYEQYAGDDPIATTGVGGDIHLATASDGNSVFALGLAGRTNPPVVYRVALPDRDEATVFFGSPDETGDGQARLNEPRGLAADGRGRVYIADSGNNRVVVVNEEDGQYVRSFEVPGPRWVGVEPDRNAVYVASGNHVVRFTLTDDGAAETARLALPDPTDRTRWSFALDTSAEPAVLWVGRNRDFGEAPLLRCEVGPDGFSDLEQPDYRPSRNYWNVAEGQDGRTVAYKVGWHILRIHDEETGEVRDVRPQGSHGQTYRLGPNNQIYGMDHWRWGVRRWNKDGEPMPFPATMNLEERQARGRLPNRPSGTTSWERDFDVDLEGNVYVKHRGEVYHGRKRVDVYDPDGNFIRTAIYVVSDGAIGPQVDPAGNIYIADIVKPPGQPIPEFFEGRLPSALIEVDQDPAQQYRWMYGSVMKFGPEGGAIWFPVPNETFRYAFEGEPDLPEDQPRAEFETVYARRSVIDSGELQGALWTRYGVSYILDMIPSHNMRCHCTATEFKVDPYGRVFYTDQGRFRIVVLDTNGNKLLTFGQYGNQDSRGPDSYVLDPETELLRPRRDDDPADLVSPNAEPEIAFNWFTGLGTTERHIYIADGGNRRIIRVAKTYATETVSPIE